ncbi:unnamed protein product, partial [Sphacelaria rigidula]
FPLGKSPYSSCASEKSNQRNRILYSIHQGRADLVHFRSTLSLLMPNGSQRLIVSYRAHDSPPSTSCCGFPPSRAPSRHFSRVALLLGCVTYSHSCSPRSATRHACHVTRFVSHRGTLF